MDKVLLVFVGALALWYIFRRISNQVKGEGGCGCCQGSCSSNSQKNCVED